MLASLKCVFGKVFYSELLIFALHMIHEQSSEKQQDA